jgi:DNA processing protein
VGARAATTEGLRRSRDLAAGLSAAGHVVISGGAMGIDAAAHEGALAAGGPTVAVLASLHILYPERNRGLFEAIVRRGGALATPLADVTPVLPRPFRFLERNHALAALCDAVVVVEGETSSGSLHTAREAGKLGRVVGAVPGSGGTELLLARGAVLVETAADVDCALRGTPRRRERPEPKAGTDAALALAALSPAEPLSVDRIGLAAGLAPARTARALLTLELDGWVLAVPGGQFLRAEVC